MGVGELADVVILGCRASNAGMSPRPSLNNDGIATDGYLLAVAYRYLDSGDNFGRWEWGLICIAGDTKAGTLIATDRYGNKYFENLEEELPREHRLGLCWMTGNLWVCSENEMGGLQGLRA